MVRVFFFSVVVRVAIQSIASGTLMLQAKKKRSLQIPSSCSVATMIKTYHLPKKLDVKDCVKEPVASPHIQRTPRPNDLLVP